MVEFKIIRIGNMRGSIKQIKEIYINNDEAVVYECKDCERNCVIFCNKSMANLEPPKHCIF